MNIRDGNIFEVMRIILPEMRTEIKRAQKEETKQEQPVLTEDAIDEIQYTLTEALEHGLIVRATLFGEYGNKTIDGVPVVEHGQLYLQTSEDWKERIPMDRLLKLEIV